MRLNEFAIIVLLALVITSQVFIIIFVVNETKKMDRKFVTQLKQEVRKEMQFDRLKRNIYELYDLMPSVTENLNRIRNDKEKYGLGGIVKKRSIILKIKERFLENWFENDNYFVNRIKEK